MDSSTADWPSVTVPSTGTDSPGRTIRMSPTATSFERHGFFARRGAAAHGLGREVEKRAHRRAGSRARTAARAPGPATPASRSRRRLRNRRAAPCPCSAPRRVRSAPRRCRDRPRHAQRDQREHVGVAGDGALPAAHEERRRRPQHDRRRQREFEPRQPRARLRAARRSSRAPWPRRTPATPAPATSRTAGACRAVRLCRPRRPGFSGSSAMPQMGQEPGPSCRICGCMGQV